MKISKKSLNIVVQMANEFNIDPEDIISLIKFESNWDPQAKNPITGAIGLIQFLDAAAKDLGYLNKEDLFWDLPSQELQLEKAVYPWLKRYAPYNSAIDLYMQIFYPAYRKKNPDTLFPENVRKVNPGIDTPRDYYNYVKKK